MATKTKEEQIFVQIDNERIELTGEEKEKHLIQLKELTEISQQITEQMVKQNKARENAIKKLAEIAGLTDEEIQAII